MADIKKPGERVEGEGSYEAAKEYEERQKKFSQSHDAQKLADEAQRDREKNPKEFDEAEKRGKDKAKT